MAVVGVTEHLFGLPASISLVPGDFLQQDSLDPQLRRMIENDNENYQRNTRRQSVHGRSRRHRTSLRIAGEYFSGSFRCRFQSYDATVGPDNENYQRNTRRQSEEMFGDADYGHGSIYHVESDGNHTTQLWVQTVLLQEVTRDIVITVGITIRGRIGSLLEMNSPSDWRFSGCILL
jgi:hypothetical protein